MSKDANGQINWLKEDQTRMEGLCIVKVWQKRCQHPGFLGDIPNFQETLLLEYEVGSALQPLPNWKATGTDNTLGNMASNRRTDKGSNQTMPANLETTTVANQLKKSTYIPIQKKATWSIRTII